MKKKAPLSHSYHQSGVIPYRFKDDKLQVLLVTSTNGKRWVIPKGIVEPHLTPAESAAQEAWEEAGVKGIVNPQMIGTYSYKKWLGVCFVEVFLLQVDQVFDTWLETFRKRKWVTVPEAVERVSEVGLKAIILQVPRLLQTVTLPVASNTLDVNL